MNKYIFFLVFFLFPFSTFAGFGGSSTFINTGTLFPKTEGVHQLEVYEEYYINPFSSSDIKINTTNTSTYSWGILRSFTTTINTTVDGVIFGSAVHPKWKNSGEIRQNWTTNTNGIQTKVTYLDNTYLLTNSGGVDYYIPNQNVKVRKEYKLDFTYDATAPTCGDVRYYDDEAMTSPFSYTGGWVNSYKYYTITCNDSVSYCSCKSTDLNCLIVKNSNRSHIYPRSETISGTLIEYSNRLVPGTPYYTPDAVVVSNPRTIGHKLAPEGYFTNSVDLSDTCVPSGGYQNILYDLKPPYISFAYYGTVDLDINDAHNRNYESISGKATDGVEIPSKLKYKTDNFYTFTDPTRLRFRLEDEYLTGSLHGVSGIKEYSVSVKRVRNQVFDAITPVDIPSCGKSDTFPEYNRNGSKEVSDQKLIQIDCDDLKISGEYRIIVEMSDFAGNETKITIPVKNYPQDVDPDKSSVVASSNGDKYANFKDTYTYTLNLRDKYSNPLFDRKILEVTSSGSHLILTDDSPKENAIVATLSGSQTDDNGNIIFTAKSYAPGNFSPLFQVKYYPWDDHYVKDTSVESVKEIGNNTPVNSFKKPFTASLSVSSSGTTHVEIGKIQDYEIQLAHVGNISSGKLTNGKVNITKNAISFSTDHKVDAISAIDNVFSLVDLITSFKANVTPTTASSALIAPVIDIDNLSIQYNLYGTPVKYILDNFGTAGCDVSTLGLKIVGNIQGGGKSSITGQKENFSDLSLTDIRTDIRKSAYSLIQNMTSGQTLNGVKYVEGNVTLSGDQSYETLIVKNGNVIISGNLNPSKNKLGIIVLSDKGYEVTTDYNRKGNLYIGNTVTEINAAIYSDGAIVSSDASGNAYSDDDITTPLKIFGVVFSKNTIGGGIDAGGEYILPGGVKTTNVSLAKRYDLNFLRKASMCSGTYDYSVKIEYNSQLQISPPKGFGL